MTLHPDEQARELAQKLVRSKEWLDTDNSDEDAELIAMLLVRVQLEEVKNAPCPTDCHSNFGLGTLPCDCWKAERIASLRQAVGEGT